MEKKFQVSYKEKMKFVNEERTLHEKKREKRT